MSSQLQVVLLLLLAGFLAGGAWSLRRFSVPAALLAGVGSGIAFAAAILRLG